MTPFSEVPSRPRLLLVDDDVSTINLLGNMLSGDGELQFATTGTDAIRLARSDPPDLILLDLEMPGQSGFDVCKELKRDPQLASVPIIVATSFSDSATEARALETGAVDFVSKPLKPSQVITRVRNQLRLRHVHERLPVKVGGATRPPRILIVDDDVSSIRFMRQALDEPGAQFYFATTGSEAVARAQHEEPDVVLLDAHMPDLNGFEVCGRFQQDERLRHTPIVFVTRYSDAETERRALELGAVDFISKPYSQAVLKARVRNVLRLKEQMDAALRMERERWRRLGDSQIAAMVAAASDAIISTDAQGVVVLINDAACALLQVSAQTVVGTPLDQLLPLSTALADGGDVANQGVWRRRMKVHRGDGSTFSAEASLWHMGEGADCVTTVLLHDLTEAEQLEQADRARVEAEAVGRTKSLMLSYIAHEIGNPLNAIMGFGQLLTMDPGDPLTGTQLKRLQNMLTAAEHLQALLRDVLDLGRFERGQFELAVGPVDIRRGLQDCAHAIESVVAMRKLTLVLDVPDDLPALMTDALRLRQCVLNLMTNAAKYNREGGQIIVSARTDGARMRIKVRDTGMGMTVDQQAQLFQPFNRLGRASSGIQGAGVGLAVTKHLIRAMGGEIFVSSAENQGSEFEIDLPLVPSTPASVLD
ncbi:response regulator [Aquabacterium sp.]|uniref:response regulator n=1 Tax=Aquabacterium sp. TaxID=1872578 RepID=UPI0035AF6F0E